MDYKNTITVRLSKGHMNVMDGLFQYDYGQKLIFKGVELPESYEVHFSNDEHGESKTAIGNELGVYIPDEYLLSGDPVYFWVFLHNDVTDGYTEYSGKIDVKKRAKPVDIEPETVEHDAISDIVAILNEKSEQIDQIETDVDQLRQDFDSFEETDPTVPEWAKQPNKPSYTASEVGAATINEVNNLIAAKADKSDTILDTTLSRGRKANTTIGEASFAFGTGLEASGDFSHAEGGTTTASGDYSHAEGGGTTASGNTSHAEGGTTTASGHASHAEGGYTVASGGASHAEGGGTTASGDQSHAEGNGTEASGVGSHAEGGGTTASGYFSHAEGSGTVANHKAQHVFGEYNVADPTIGGANYRGNYAEIVGNGTTDFSRSNARTLDWNGNEELAGDLTINKGTADEVSVSDLKDAVDGKLDEPSTAGTAGQVLTSDGQGGQSWQDADEGSIIPIFTNTNDQWSCNMTFSEVMSALQANNCEGCLINGSLFAPVTYYYNDPYEGNIQFSCVDMLGTNKFIMKMITYMVGEYIDYFERQANTLDTLAKEYSSSDSSIFPISVGDYYTYNGKLYKANTSIPTAESFKPAKWDEVKVTGELSNLENKIDSKIESLTFVITSSDADTMENLTCDTAIDDIIAAYEDGKELNFILRASIGGRVTLDQSGKATVVVMDPGSSIPKQYIIYCIVTNGNNSSFQNAIIAGMKHQNADDWAVVQFESLVRDASNNSNGFSARLKKIIDVDDPTNDTDAATKGYVDSVIPDVSDKLEGIDIVLTTTSPDFSDLVCDTSVSDIIAAIEAGKIVKATFNVIAQGNPVVSLNGTAYIMSMGFDAASSPNKTVVIEFEIVGGISFITVQGLAVPNSDDIWEANTVSNLCMIGSSANSSFDARGTKINRVGTPTNATDAATKGYVDGAIPDIQVNGTSIVSNGVANVPIAGSSNIGAVKIDGSFGLSVPGSDGILKINCAGLARTKAGTNAYEPIVASHQHESAFYGLAKAAGADMKNSSNTVGTYTNEAKAAIQNMLDVPSTSDMQSTVIVDDNQPQQSTNKLWIDTNEELTEFQVPTVSEMNAALNSKVSDVQINGSSIVNNGTANIPIASTSTIGAIKVGSGLYISSAGALITANANDATVKAGTHANEVITPGRQHMSVFYGLAKAAGADMASSSNPVGTYTPEALKAIRKMLGIPNMEWELISDVTIDTNSTQIYADTDLSGQPFKLRKLVAIFRAGPSTTGTRDTFYGQAFKENIGTAFPSMTYPTATSNMNSRIEIEAANNMPLHELVVTATSEGNTQNATMMTKGDSFSIDYITKLRIYQSASDKSLIPANSNLKIYGIRYDD